jgi:hypothetical protein
MAHVYHNPLADLDPRLLTEAFRRARENKANSGVDSDTLLSAIIAEARKGVRDLYGLVKAAHATQINQVA